MLHQDNICHESVIWEILRNAMATAGRLGRRSTPPFELPRCVTRRAFYDVNACAGTPLDSRILTDGTVDRASDPLNNIHIGVLAESAAGKYGLYCQSKDEFAL